MPPKSRREMVNESRVYQRLLGDLRQLIAAGRLRAEEAASRVLVESYHALGTRILAAKLSERAGYGAATMQRLAKDLDVNVRLLHEAVSFARLYPKLPGEGRRLHWSHYRELLTIKDPRARGFYEQQASKQKWTRNKLVEAIRAQQHRRLLMAEREMASPKKKPVTLPRPGGAHRVYKAQVEQVVDGELLLVMIELGFDLYARQRVRLAHIDAPPLREAKGQQAQRFMQEVLAAVEFVMLKTVSRDGQGRHTVHLFYEPESRDEGRIFSEGHHLNQELVDRGLAQAL